MAGGTTKTLPRSAEKCMAMTKSAPISPRTQARSFARFTMPLAPDEPSIADGVVSSGVRKTVAVKLGS